MISIQTLRFIDVSRFSVRAIKMHIGDSASRYSSSSEL